MSEQKNVEENMIPNDEDEALEVREGMIVEKESVEAPIEPSPFSGKTTKYSKAKSLIKKAKNIVDNTTKRIDACRRMYESSQKAYEEARSALQQGGFDASVSLLNQLKYQVLCEEAEKPVVVFSTQEEWKPFRLKDISSGRITGLFYALLGGITTVVGMVYIATEKLEMILDVRKVPSENQIESILAWFSTIIGVQEDVAIGTSVLGFIVLSVMIFIYKIRMSLKARSNLHLAVKQFVEAELYAVQKADCKEKMEKIDTHVQDIIGTLKAYQILLNEQKGKLQRILYFEGEKEKGAMYHERSLAEIEDTKGLIESISGVLNVPIEVDEKITDESILALQNAKDKLYTFIKRF